MHYLSFTWNPSEGIDLGFFMIRYYSLMFVVAFTLGWILTKKIFEREGQPQEKLDSLFIYMVVATLVGARLGHVIFYQPELFVDDPLSVFLPIQTKPEFEFTGFQGLASHGAAIAILIAMYFYTKNVIKKPFLWIMDRIVIAVAAGGIFVRIGNFMNSEIIGKISGEFPLGVRFVHEGIRKQDAVNATGIKEPSKAYDAIVHNPQFSELLNSVPFRHPAQLYEAAGYVIVFLVCWYLYWKTERRKQIGYIFGVFLILLFMVRFLVEYVKESQGGFESALGLLSTGQWLSIPFIIAGIYIMWKASKKSPLTPDGEI
ncbi:prolipoprotein diacylglyceryl transferase [Aequorivita soesokkakensis]|uniref:Phosphatidylglycerol--prolipoprotein diacylglyceryl transferase n=1 Tax=Aequorivita soesokkakensis TaxID=1385699 RepID=A0A1A9LFX4_9FLAO|nr:prolipoprotein diacylglyceryl transferase [Aequorivita soesokkakensis]OAD91612.1 prolipoprotein diacylglyceryl transferase [Aequorivita soesokkakensis]